MAAKYSYLAGYEAHHQSEALPGAVPKDQNSPQVCPYGLYAEQLSGTAFTVPRRANMKTWFYRIRPSVTHIPFKKLEGVSERFVRSFGDLPANPNQLRWSPFALPSDSERVNFVQGLATLCGAGDPTARHGLAIHIYAANTSMTDSAFQSSDGDWLIVPQLGTLDIRTEYGFLEVPPNHIAIIPRGIRFAASLPDGPSRGYILEVFNGHFELPDLGPIGANGLANARHFEFPVASFEEKEGPFTIYNKYQGEMFYATQNHSCFDVVGWHGNYAPCRYDLSKFNVFNSVSFDHADPSIFTVLTVKSSEPGVALADFVIFPPRWGVAEHTFRPPYYHRNCMSEFMGLILGNYEAKGKEFAPGGGSLHSIMTPHGPDSTTFERASTADLKPERVAEGTQSFMFETFMGLKVTPWALASDGPVQADYYKAWQNLGSKFDRNWKPSN